MMDWAADSIESASGGGRSSQAHLRPVVLIRNLGVGVGDLRVEISTDSGSSFAVLAPPQFNLTEELHEASLGAGVRLFQYLADIPAGATGSASVVFRFTPEPQGIPLQPPLAIPIGALGVLGVARYWLARTRSGERD